jgi:hypothetical protein
MSIRHTTQLKTHWEKEILANDAKIYTDVDKALIYASQSQPEYQMYNKNNFIQVLYINLGYI